MISLQDIILDPLGEERRVLRPQSITVLRPIGGNHVAIDRCLFVRPTGDVLPPWPKANTP